jgi:rhodanese-related sulfurtransferase
MSEAIPGLHPSEAFQLLHDNPRAVLVDCRSSMEFLFVGHPVGAINIPWIDEPNWDVNPHFVAEVRKLLLGGAACEAPEDCAPVLLICRSGKRSVEAGRLLLKAGVSNVYNVLEGFEGDLDEHHHRSTRGGWRHHGLPWEQC